MRISTKGRYGLRALIDLALQKNREQVSLINIAERQEISKSYLEQVFSALRKAGIVKSVKGAQGGYALAREPKDTTVGMVLRALEGELSVVPLEDVTGIAENKIENYIRNHIWSKIDERVNDFVDAVTLEDIINDLGYSGDTLMYYI